MKIAVVNRHRDHTLGGSELQCDFISGELTDRGHEVYYIAPGMAADDLINSYSYHVWPCSFSGTSIREKLAECNPDIIYWRFNKHYFLDTVRWCRKKKIPFIFAASSVNDVNPGFYKWNAGFRNMVRSLYQSYRNHLGFRYIDALTVNNREHLGKLKVSPQLFIPNGMKKQAEPFGWERPYCAWVSNIKQIKRPEVAVDLARDLEPVGIDVLMAGKLQDKNYSWLEKKDQLPSNLHYLGGVTPEKVNGILKNAAVHIHTCYPEGFPNVFIQAWIQGTPSVTFGYDPNGYIESKKIGYHVHENRQDFAERVTSLVKKEEKREQMGHRAMEFAENLFSIKKSVDKIEALMRSVIENRSG